MVLDSLILLIVLLTLGILWLPRLTRDKDWRAMITPLASIIGSGFLVLGPILDVSYGKYAPLMMLVLVGVAFLFGSAIRFNMHRKAGRLDEPPRIVVRIETLAHWALGFAYIISVCYYLSLFGAFAMSLADTQVSNGPRIITTASLVLIVFVGWTRGFRMMEQLEYVSVTVKLAIIAGLLVGLFAYFFGKIEQGALLLNEPALTGWSAITLGFGLLITVQGFEISRYLGDTYDCETRIRSMRWAQYVSGAIYMAYILLLAFVFEPGELAFSETGIIDMMRVVTPLLPVLLVGAALAAQFSAAVADTGGAGGLFEELTGGKVSQRIGYLLLAVLALGLTWSANIFEIINYASRAFAFYYGVEALLATVSAVRMRKPAHALLFGVLTLLGVAIVIFGQPVEGQ